MLPSPGPFALPGCSALPLTREMNSIVEPLEGYRAVRVGTSRAGRFLEGLLRDQGVLVVTATPDALPDPADIAGADILIDDAPGLGFDWTRGRRTDSVLCHITGAPENPFGLATDDLDDIAISAVLGLHRMSGEPLQPEPLPVPSYYAALLAAVYIAAALLRQEGGVELTVPLLTAALTVLSREELRLDDERLLDIANLPHLPNVAIYRCADGRYIQPHGLYDHFVEIMLRVAGREDWIADGVRALHCLPDRESVELWRTRFRELFATRPALDWERAITEAGGACTMLRSAREWAAEPTAVDSEILDSEGVLGRAVRVSASLNADAPLPWSGPSGPLPLSGITVLDFCIVLAGPTCGRVLAELGADVIKVDDPRRFISPYPWFDVNRSKRSVILDLKAPGAGELVRRLVQRSDVILQNFRSGKIDRFGLSIERLSMDGPGRVVGALDAFDFGGDWETRPGWEHNAQAASGMQLRRSRDGLPRQVPFAVDDFATGLAGAFGIVCALVRRRATGSGSIVRGSLVRTATYLQSTPAGRRRVFDPVQPDDDIRSELIPFRCADGWVWSSGGSSSFAELSMDETLLLLRAQGTRAVAESGPSDPAVRSWMLAHRLITRWRHPRLGVIEQLTPLPDAPGLSRTPGWPSPEPGDDGDTIARELGYDDAEVAALLRSGALGEPHRFFARVDLSEGRSESEGR